ncbi:MAG: AraC family transcriptional regulator [Bacilli bacterium]|jgi:AraC family transcriptional regulator
MDLLEIFKQSIDFIEEHLTDELSVKDVAAHVYVSSFYFQRMFSAVTGLSVGDYIRKRRLSLAAQELLIDDVKIIDLAYKYGYETPESFARAFRKFHGVLPNEVKKHSEHIKLCPRLEIIVSIKGGKTMDYKITNREAFKITMLIKKFKSETSMKEIPDFWMEFFHKGYHKDVCPMLGVCLPVEIDQKEFAYGIGAFNECVKRVPEGFEERIVPAGTWAEFSCVGAMPDAIQKTWRKIYTEWLPNSRYEIIPGYDFEVYEEGDTASVNYRSSIWVPVRLKA